MKGEKEIIKGLKQLKTAIKPKSIWFKESENKLLAYFKEKSFSLKNHFFVLKPLFVISMILAVFLFSGSFILKAAEKSLPGESLYPVKKFSEKIVLKFAPAKKRPILRAEIVQKRLKEFQQLASKGGVIDSKISPQLTKSIYEFQEEFTSLKKEIGLQTEKSLISPDLPIQDNKKIVALIQNQDLEKLLKETKEALKENQVELATEKTLEVEKIISQTEEKEENKVQEEQIKETKEEIPSNSQFLKIEPKEKPSDFKIDPIQETNSFKTDLIRE